MAEKFLCVLAGYDDRTEETLSALQNHLYARGFSGTQTRDVPQHVTLGYADVAQEAEMIRRMEEAAAECAPFDVSFSHIGLFSGGKVLFAAPDCNETLLALAGQFGDCFGWTPHNTMLIDEPETVAKAVPILLERFSPFVGRITSLHLYEFFPTRHILSLPLK